MNYLSSGTVIDFEAVGVVNAPSLTVSDVTFSADANIVVDSAFAGLYNMRGRYNINGNQSSSFLFEFATPVSAFGFLWGASNVDWELTAFNGNTFLDSFTISPTTDSNNEDYFGIMNNSGITQATLTSSGGVHVFIDNFTVSPVPEPSTITLFGLGLAMLLFFGKRAAHQRVVTSMAL